MPIRSSAAANTLAEIDPRCFDTAQRSRAESTTEDDGAFLARANGALALRLVQAAEQTNDPEVYLRGATDVLRAIASHLEGQRLNNEFGVGIRAN